MSSRNVMLLVAGAFALLAAVALGAYFIFKAPIKPMLVPAAVEQLRPGMHKTPPPPDAGVQIFIGKSDNGGTGPLAMGGTPPAACAAITDIRAQNTCVAGQIAGLLGTKCVAQMEGAQRAATLGYQADRIAVMYCFGPTADNWQANSKQIAQWVVAVHPTSTYP